MFRMLNKLFDRLPILDQVAIFLVKRVRRRRNLNYLKRNPNIHPSVVLGDVFLDKNVSIGEGTYINSGQIFAGKNSKVTIGRFCAIGYNVHIKARSHDPVNPTRADWNEYHRNIEGDIIIGDHVWIGDNVFIGPSISIGSQAIIGANAVVTRDVESNTIVGGVPARVIRKREPTLD